MGFGLWPALEQGEGRGSIVYGGCCGALLLIRVLSPRLEFIRRIGAGCAWGIHRYVHVHLSPTFMDVCALVSAPGPASGGTLFWEM